MRALIVLFAMLAFSVPLYAQDDDINREIANCEEIRDPATQTQLDFCSAHIGCKLVIGIQKACTKVKTFLDKLKNLSFGKEKIDSSDVFDAAAPSAEGDVGFSNVSGAIKSSYDQQPKKEIVSGKFESGVRWVYEGAMSNGARNGTGVLITDTGTLFRGDFVEGRQAGMGELVNDKSRKAGVMAGAKVDGYGVERNASGTRYEGEFKADKYDGKGVMTFANGSRLEASFKDGMANGRGVLTTRDGDRYEGDYVNNQRSGQGIYQWANGDRYTGAFAANVRTGLGTYRWADGDEYTGSFVKNKMHGRGSYKSADGSRFDGVYRDDKRLDGTAIKADGTKLSYANGEVVRPSAPPEQVEAAAETNSGVDWGNIIRGVADIIKAGAEAKARASGGGGGGDDNHCHGTCTVQ